MDSLQQTISGQSSSTAVVLYEGTEQRSETKDKSFYWLVPGIDLNVPPHNWLRASSPLEQYVQRMLYRKSTPMSSLDIAMSNIDLVDHIDVISDAKNIRNLLKMLFDTEAPISIMVHRIGKTLLLNEFDVHKHLLRKQKDEWNWIRDFYLTQVINQQVAKYPRQQKTHQELQDKSMFSKFLYYSIMPPDQTLNIVNETPLGETSEGRASTDMGQGQRVHFPQPSMAQGAESGDFARTVEWNFEDIKMLIGTDLAIFSEGSSRVSLRLRDSDTPITVLTGLDYWLDNLMCSVPEIAMCYHQSGFVQRYERLSTCDLPKTPGAEFEPNTVCDIAQNILSFLKSNATKLGHTYWLYKEKNGDIIKLYDLTSLCDSNDARQDPFRLPLANLLFRVAFNLHKRGQHKKSGIIEALLTNGLVLLEGEHPEMAVHALSTLTELYFSDDKGSIPCMTDDDDDDDDDHDDDDDGDDGSVDESDDTDLPSGEAEKESTFKEFNISALSCRNRTFTKDVLRFPPISGGMDVRCNTALKHIAKALAMIDKDFDTHYKDVPIMAKPSEAIPLPYETLNKEQILVVDANEEPKVANASDSSVKSSVKSILERLNRFTQSRWHKAMKMKLLRKAMVVYHRLADCAAVLMEQGAALRYLKLALTCIDALQCLDPQNPGGVSIALPQILRLCGDTQLKLALRSASKEPALEYQQLSVDDLIILNSCSLDTPYMGFEWAHKLYRSVEKRLLIALQCYEQCLSLVQKEGELSEVDSNTRRLGNCCNELAVFYMTKASQLYTKDYELGDPVHASQIEELIRASGPYLEQGLSLFRSISDRSNEALLLSNSGRLLRIRAQVMNPPVRGEITDAERQLYDLAADAYLQALTILGKRDISAQIWDLVTFELSGVYCTIASLLQDFAPLSSRCREEIERDVTSLMLKALKYCDSGGATSKDIPRLYRTATIHHRLASLFHNAYRNTVSEQKARQLRSMTESHYIKASQLFLSLESHVELFRVILEQVALQEYDFHNATSVHIKSKALDSALSLLLDVKVRSCLNVFQFAEEHSPTEEQDIIKLLNIYTGRLQFVILELVKLTVSDKKNKNIASSQHQKFKNMYKAALTIEAKGCAKAYSRVIRESLSTLDSSVS